MKSGSLYYDYGGANVVGYHYWLDREDIGFIRYNCMLGSGADDDTKVAVLPLPSWLGTYCAFSVAC